MGDITDIKSKEDKALADLFGTALELDTVQRVTHAGGAFMVVGHVYEMYIPAAKGAAERLGIIWRDTVGYSFVYTGTVSMRGNAYIATRDVKYGGDAIPARVAVEFTKLRAALNGSSPLCPIEVVSQLIRPVTEG